MWTEDCCILNSGDGAWVFNDFAHELSKTLWVDISDTPKKYNYLLYTNDLKDLNYGELFIPFPSIEIASDKRLLADVLASKLVPTPITKLVGSLDEAEHVCSNFHNLEWCLKYPTGCGASGHRFFQSGMSLPENWPYPLIIQEFIRLDRPEVFRLYSAGGELFGWVSRCFPKGVKTSPWVAHACGAKYELVGKAPAQALDVARMALDAVGLLNSFGCVDLLLRPTGDWVVLEVGTDGLFNHIDRDLGIPELEYDIQRRVAEAFWSRVGYFPWGSSAWHPRH
jgi:hypothetical protein